MSQSPAEIRNSELAAWRNTVITDLRDLIALLGNTTQEQFPTPNLHFGVYSRPAPTDDNIYNEPSLTQNDVRAFMAASPGNWHKYSSQDTITYSKRIGESVRLSFYVGRKETCTRVQIGTKRVEATEAHDEPVYEWRCDTPELEV